MAQHVSVLLIDDINGEEAERTVQFGLDGRDYEIDLTKKNAEQLEKALASFVEKARRVSAAPARKQTRRTTTTGPDASKVRAWAQMNSIEVNERGRIPKEIIERYEAANGKAPAEPAKDAQKPAEAAEKPATKETPTEAPKSPQKGTQSAEKATEKPSEKEKAPKTATAK